MFKEEPHGIQSNLLMRLAYTFIAKMINDFKSKIIKIIIMSISTYLGQYKWCWLKDLKLYIEFILAYNFVASERYFYIFL